MNGFNVEALAQWWNLNMDGASKPYWVLHRSAGGRPGPTIANFGSEDVNASWVSLVETIQNSIGQGVYEFWVVGRPGGVNDTKGKVEYQLRANGYSGSANIGTIGGMYPQAYGGMAGYPVPAPQSVDIAGITAEIREKVSLEKDMEIMKLKHELQLEKMEDMIAGIQNAKQTNFDRLLETLNNPEVAQGFIGLIGTIKQLLTPVQLAPGIGNVPAAATRTRRKPQVVEHPAAVNIPYPHPGTEDGPDDHDDDHDDQQGSDADFEPIPGLENDYDHALSAVNVLHAAGWEHPGELLLKVSQFAIQNPQMAKQMIATL